MLQISKFIVLEVISTQNPLLSVSIETTSIYPDAAHAAHKSYAAVSASATSVNIV